MSNIPNELWALLTAVAGLIGGYFTSRLTNKGKEVDKAPDIQTSLNTMVSSMREHYERLLTIAQNDIRELRAENVTMRRELDRLERHVDRLEAAMSKAGVEIPARPEGG